MIKENKNFISLEQALEFTANRTVPLPYHWIKNVVTTSAMKK